MYASMQLEIDYSGPLALMLGMAFFVFMLTLLWNHSHYSSSRAQRDFGPRPAPPPANPDSPPRILAAPTVSTEEVSQPDGNKENRRSARRTGRPVRILLSTPASGDKPIKAWIIDRSRGGLGLLVPRPIPVDTLLHVRAADAPDNIPWIPVRVRHCRKRRHRWRIGCRFEQELAWSVLLLFG